MRLNDPNMPRRHTDKKHLMTSNSDDSIHQDCQLQRKTLSALKDLYSQLPEHSQSCGVTPESCANHTSRPRDSIQNKLRTFTHLKTITRGLGQTSSPLGGRTAVASGIVGPHSGICKAITAGLVIKYRLKRSTAYLKNHRGRS